MAGQIRSRHDAADNYANNLANSVSSLNLGSLYGVNDDNTLAESGVYNSYNALRSTFQQFKQVILSDAENLKAAANAIEEADSAVANAQLAELGRRISSLITEKK